MNLLTLMLVCDLEELDQPSIDYLKEALFLDISEEEATVMFKGRIQSAKGQWYRKLDNVFHVVSDVRKDARLHKREARAERAKEAAAREKRAQPNIEEQN